MIRARASLALSPALRGPALRGQTLWGPTLWALALSALALSPLAGTAVAAPPAPPREVIQGLVRGEQEGPGALRALQESGVSPKQAMELIGAVRKLSPKAGDASFELSDDHGRSTEVLTWAPQAPRADGRYGLMIVLHGLGGNAKQLMQFARNIAPPGTIVAAPGAVKLPPTLENEDVPSFGGEWSPLPHWWRYHREGFPLAALRHLKREFPIDTNRVLLIGYSMGGYGTWGTGLRFPGEFAAIAPLAGGLSRLENLMPRDAKNRRLLHNARGLPTWFIHGNADRVVPVRFSRTIHEDLTKAGIDHVYHEVEQGPHILMPFLRGNDLTGQLVAWLKEQVRDPWPEEVSHTVLGTYHGRRSWLRVEEIEGQHAQVSARVEGNRIQLEGENVADLTLFLSPKLGLDLSQPVRVQWKERVLYVGMVQPSLEAVLESWRESEDPALLAPAMLRLRPAQRAEF